MKEHRDSARFVRALNVEHLPAGESRVVTLEGHLIALFNTGGRIFAVDNRCPTWGSRLIAAV